MILMHLKTKLYIINTTCQSKSQLKKDDEHRSERPKTNKCFAEKIKVVNAVEQVTQLKWN